MRLSEKRLYPCLQLKSAELHSAAGVQGEPSLGHWHSRLQLYDSPSSHTSCHQPTKPLSYIRCHVAPYLVDSMDAMIQTCLLPESPKPEASKEAATVKILILSPCHAGFLCM